jgi:aerobic C4-dicarboxylate transport protein
MQAKLYQQLWFQVLFAMLVGIALGIYAPDLGEKMKPFGDAFISLVRMIIAPIIFCTVVHGIAGMGDMKRAGRVAIKALIYFEVITTIALVVALLAVNAFQPGAGMHVDAAALDTKEIATYATRASEQSITGFLLGMIPTTFISAFVQSDVLQVLLVSVLFAFALIMAGDYGKPVLALIDSTSQVLFKIVGYIMWVAPIGAFGAIAFTVGKFGSGSLVTLGTLIIEFYAVCLLFVLVVLGLVAYWAGVNLFRLLYYIREELLVVAATTSTETVLPRIMQKLRGLGCEESVVGLVVPTGYSFNLDGTCLYLAFVTVFLAQATGTPLDIGQQVTLLLVLLLVSKGAAGVAGAALVVLAATLSSMGTIPMTSLALIVGIHRLLAEALTFVNLVGNCVATIVVAKWERAVDERVLREQVGF